MKFSVPVFLYAFRRRRSFTFLPFYFFTFTSRVDVGVGGVFLYELAARLHVVAHKH